jgi:hypothetical protein
MKLLDIKEYRKVLKEKYPIPILSDEDETFYS